MNKFESRVAWLSPLRLSGQVPVFSGQVSWPGFTAVEAGVEVGHPDVEEGEEEDDHQDADDGAVHFPKLPARAEVLIRLLLDLELLQPGACSGACEDTLEPILTSIRLEAGAGRLNIELVWPWQAPHPSPRHQLAPAFFPREQSWTEAVLLALLCSHGSSLIRTRVVERNGRKVVQWTVRGKCGGNVKMC